MESCYQTLGVAPDADFQAIKKAYFRCAKRCHPDLFGGDRGKEEEFKRLVHAFDTLSDPESRQRHDRELWEAARAAWRGRQVASNAGLAKKSRYFRKSASNG